MANEIHHLQYLPHEDEAQRTGMSFQKITNGQAGFTSCKIKVWTTFHGYDEWEKDSEQIMEADDARKLWKSLIKSGEYTN